MDRHDDRCARLGAIGPGHRRRRRRDDFEAEKTENAFRRMSESEERRRVSTRQSADDQSIQYYNYSFANNLEILDEE